VSAVRDRVDEIAADVGRLRRFGSNVHVCDRLAGNVEALYEKVQEARRDLQRELSERERILFDLAMARAVARDGRVYLAESADVLAAPDSWRPHMFFSTQADADAYAHQLSSEHFGAATRVREVTPDELLPNGDV
jgi:hypothetical protein